MSWSTLIVILPFSERDCPSSSGEAVVSTQWQVEARRLRVQRCHKNGAHAGTSAYGATN